MSRDSSIQVTPTASNEEFAIWLGERFSGDEHAARVQLIQVGIANRHGEAVFTFDAKPDTTDGKKGTAAARAKLSREKLVELSNRMLEAAQRDCDALRRSTLYAAIASDPRMGSEPHSRFLLRLSPKNAYTSVAGVASDDEDGVVPTKLLLTLLESERRDKRWMAELMANTVSGALERDAVRIEKMEMLLDARLEKETKFIEATEAALSRATDRKMRDEWNALKVASVRDGVELLKGLLPSTAAALSNGRVGVGQAVRQFMGSLTRRQLIALVGSESLASSTGGLLSAEQARVLRRIDEGETYAVRELFASLSAEQFAQVRGLLTQEQLLTIGQVADGLDGVVAPISDSPNSEMQTSEQSALGKFIDALESAGVDIAMMGDWGVDDKGALELRQPGILTGDQVLTLLRVRRGDLPVTALDDLVPGSGMPMELTAAQQNDAQQILPPTAAAAIAELLASRASARSSADKGDGR